ncbi:MAG: hypothetical protein EZS28_047027, partial [Streblomastix strix]
MKYSLYSFYSFYSILSIISWDKIVGYIFTGAIRHKGGFIGGNSKLRNGSRIGMEIYIDSNPKTLTFFDNDEEQKNFVTNIPNTVRIFYYIWVNNTSFKITKFEFLSTPTANHEKGSRALEYGKLWGNGIRFAMAQALIVCYSPTSNTKLIS